MPPVDIRVVDTFPEPSFSELVEEMFFASRPAIRIAESDLVQLPSRRGQGFKLRIGAFEGERLIGWSYGEQDGFDNFFMQSSGVVESHRRRGIYTQLLRRVIEEVEPYGFARICSLHVCTNNAILIPKLKAGFVVTGMKLHPKFGVMLELSYNFDKKLDAAYRFRSGERIADPIADDVSDWSLEGFRRT